MSTRQTTVLCNNQFVKKVIIVYYPPESELGVEGERCEWKILIEIYLKIIEMQIRSATLVCQSLLIDIAHLNLFSRARKWWITKLRSSITFQILLETFAFRFLLKSFRNGKSSTLKWMKTNRNLQSISKNNWIMN